MVGFLDVRFFFLCCDVIFPEAQLPWPSPKGARLGSLYIKRKCTRMYLFPENGWQFPVPWLFRGCGSAQIQYLSPIEKWNDSHETGTYSLWESSTGGQGRMLHCSGVTGTGPVGAFIKVGRWSLQDPKSLLVFSDCLCVKRSLALGLPCGCPTA